MSSYVIAIPCYRCEKQIVRVIRELDELPELLKVVQKVLFIDNGSTDGTVDEIKRALPLTKHLRDKSVVLENDKNYGLGGTHKVAFDQAAQLHADYVFILHGDNQAVTKELLDLYLLSKDHPEADAVLGSRFSRQSRLSGYSKVRIMGNKALNALYSLFYLRNVSDLGSGINLFKISSFDLSKVSVFSDHFTFNMDLLLYLISSGKNIIYHPISWREVDQVSNARNIKVGSKAFLTLVQWRLGQRHPDSLYDSIERYTSKAVWP